VSNSFLPLNDLSADDLASALRESGIKRKVIIVSACYAAKFIEPLRDDNTIIIAAAAADRTSFGCSDDRDLTYFGETFYRDALPVSSDLKMAFEKARAAIAAREKAEGKEASNPTAYFGLGLVDYLQTAFPRTERFVPVGSIDVMPAKAEKVWTLGLGNPNEQSHPRYTHGTRGPAELRAQRAARSDRA
jgi:hypothetical protein